MHRLRILLFAPLLAIASSCEKDDPAASLYPAQAGHFSFRKDYTLITGYDYSGGYDGPRTEVYARNDSQNFHLKAFVDLKEGEVYELDSTGVMLYISTNSSQPTYFCSDNGVFYVEQLDTVNHFFSGTFRGYVKDSEGNGYSVDEGVFGIIY